MSNKVKDIDIKNRIYYFYNNINIKNFDPNNIKINEKSYRNYSYLLHWIRDDQRLKVRKN